MQIFGVVHVGVLLDAINKGLGKSKTLLNEAQITSAEKVCLAVDGCSFALSDSHLQIIDSRVYTQVTFSSFSGIALPKFPLYYF